MAASLFEEIRIRICRHNNPDRLTQAEQLLNHEELNRRKTGESIEHNRASANECGISDHAAQKLRNLLGRQIPAAQIIQK